MGFAFIMFLLVTIIAVAVDKARTNMRQTETRWTMNAVNRRVYGKGVDNIKELDIILKNAKELFDKVVKDGVTNGSSMSAKVYEQYKNDIRNKYCGGIDPFDWCINEANIEMGSLGYCKGWHVGAATDIAANYYEPKWAIELGGDFTYDDYEHPESIYKGLELYNEEYNKLTFLYWPGESTLRDYCKYGYLKTKEDSGRRNAYRNRGFSEEEIDKMAGETICYVAPYKGPEPTNDMLDDKYTGHPFNPINQKYRKKN